MKKHTFSMSRGIGVLCALSVAILAPPAHAGGDGITEAPLLCKEVGNLSVTDVRHNGCNVTVEGATHQ